ncbi:HisA/HisF-related TIM barrel protein [SAR116 cluster bacterium]|nr:HisA/HisF-related TIM barrel protein [SAR116 cluster bacterium]
MNKVRLIAVLLVCDGVVVQTRKFRRTNMVGSAFTAVDFFNGWAVDEICVLNISDDHETSTDFISIVEELSKRCFVPLSVGGKIRLPELGHDYIRAGADRLVFNSAIVENPHTISELADAYGKQCIILSVDGAENEHMKSGFEAVVNNGTTPSGVDLLDIAIAGMDLGVGELMINSLSHDGNKNGYHINMIRKITAEVNVPVIAMGGVGDWQHLVDGVKDGGASAVAAGNIFHYSEHSTKKAKEFMIESGVNCRKPEFYKLNSTRWIKYKV